MLSKLVKTQPTVDSNTDYGDFPGSKGILNALGRGRGNKFGIFKRLEREDITLPGTLPVEKDQFYYHTDHLGSSNIITDIAGSVYQHLEYFPYGETWIEEGGTYNGNTPPYKFTGKELDPETGLYYFGARYYDPVLSKWISADPIIDKFLPNLPDPIQLQKNWQPEQDLPGSGGVFSPLNINLYAYAHLNPVILIDPDGMAIIVIDPGHGDIFNKWLDPGALGIGNKPPHEKDYALTLAKAIGSGLEKLGHTVIYTRIGDVTEKQQRFKWRADIANKVKADYFISVHLNMMPEDRNYFMVGYISEKGRILAEKIVSKILGQQGFFSKAVAERHGYQVLKLTQAIAILIEAGNINNPQNVQIITNPSFIEQIVEGIQKGIIEIEKLKITEKKE